MAKTTSQVSRSQVKKEEYEDKPTLEKLLHDTKSTSNNKKKKKIIKKQKTVTTKPTQAQIVMVKSENTDDSKEILALSMRTLIRSNITTEQITELIDYIVNDKMSVPTAARKTRMSYSTAKIYYQQYQNDPEHKIPSPKATSNNLSLKVTQKKIEDLITYIVQEKMSVYQAATKTNLSTYMACKYYKKYMEDPDRKIPVLAASGNRSFNYYTQNQIKDLIGYIVDDGMTIAIASKEANVGINAARKYYLKYLKDPNHEIPVPGKDNDADNKRCTNDQVKRLIGYIVDDGRSILEASIIVNISKTAAKEYYEQHLDDPNHDISTSSNNYHCYSHKSTFLEQIKTFFCCIIIDKSSVKEASLKAKIPNSTGRYYVGYLKNLTITEKSTNMTYSVEKMKKMVEYIQNDKMTMKSAAINANLSYGTAGRFYRRYMENPQLGIPKGKHKQLTQEDIKTLIYYIEHDKMTVLSAAKKAKICSSTAYAYYKEYQNDSEHKIPVPRIRGHNQKYGAKDKYGQLVADIYKNNPSIEPIHEMYSRSDSYLPYIGIKQELLGEDMKIMLKNEE